MSLCPYAYLRVSLSGLLTASDQGSLTTFGELFNISALDPLLPTLLIATLCLCVLLTILYYSLAVAWEVFWASRRSPSPLDPSAEVVLTLWCNKKVKICLGNFRVVLNTKIKITHQSLSCFKCHLTATNSTCRQPRIYKQ